MSILRDIRLVAAQHLALPSTVRASFVDLLHELDMELDREGYDPGPAVQAALKKFEVNLLDITEATSATNEEEIFDDMEVFIDIEDIDLIDPSTEDE